MFQRINSVIAAACIFALLIGCGTKDPAAERAVRMKEAQERIIRAKTRDERVAAQGALRQLQIQEGTGFQSQQQNPTK
jgi:hypothetical protein